MRSTEVKLVSCPDPPSKTPSSSWRVEGGCGYETKAKQEVNDSEHGQELSNYPFLVFTLACIYPCCTLHSGPMGWSPKEQVGSNPVPWPETLNQRWDLNVAAYHSCLVIGCLN